MHVRIRPDFRGLATTGVLLLATAGLLSSVPGAAAAGAAPPRTAPAAGKAADEGADRDAGLLGTTVETLCRGLGAAGSVAGGEAEQPASRVAGVGIGGAELEVPPRVRACPGESAGDSENGEKTAKEIAKDTATRTKDASGD